MRLWSYLASWGMLRGSSVLLQCSPAVFKGLIGHFDSISKCTIWCIDVDSYNNSNKQLIINEYNAISKILNSSIHNVPSVTLVTKIMLGVFGCVPAFDTFFTKAFRTLYGDFRTISISELNYIEDFYVKHRIVIDKMQVPVIDFEGNPTKLFYKKAKLIDMFGFSVGQYIKP